MQRFSRTIDLTDLPDKGIIIFENFPDSLTIDKIRSLCQLELVGTENIHTKNRINFAELTETLAGTILKYGKVFYTGDGKNKRYLDVEIEFTPCKFYPGMSRDEWAAEVHKNAVDGDFRIRLDGGEWMYIDVKGGSRIAKDSLDRFRSDGWYLMNAVGDSGSKFYYLVRNNAAFQQAVREIGILEGNLYDIHFDRTLDINKYRDIEINKLLDPTDYESSLRGFQAVLSAHGIRDIRNNSVC